MSEARFGRIVAVHGNGSQFPTMFTVDIREDKTQHVFTPVVPNQQSAHPLYDVAAAEKARRGPGFSAGRPIRLEGVKVAFWEPNPDAGRSTGWVMHRDEYEECDLPLDEEDEENNDG